MPSSATAMFLNQLCMLHMGYIFGWPINPQLEMAVLAAKYHTRQKIIHNSAKTYILAKEKVLKSLWSPFGIPEKIAFDVGSSSNWSNFWPK